jgi:AraC-like DNA-binding protein
MAARRSHPTWKTARRLELPLSKVGVPHVIMLGHYNYLHARPALPPHSHRDAMEFCFLHRGQQTYCVNGCAYRLTGGDIFVTFPDETHSTGDQPEEKGVLHWLIVEIPSANGRFLGLPKSQAEALRTALLQLPTRHFRANNRIPAHIEAIFRCYFTPRTPLRDLALHHHTIELLLEVLASAAAAQSASAAKPRSAFSELTAWIERSLEEPITLAALAQRVGLSLPRFKTWFRENSGLPPAEYLLRARVAAARERLRHTTTPITAIAHALNFASSQHFATAVKRITGLTPGQIRAGETVKPSGYR